MAKTAQKVPSVSTKMSDNSSVTSTRSKAIKKASKKQVKSSSAFTKKVNLHRNQKDYFGDFRCPTEQFESLDFATRAVHAGCQPDPVHGGVAPVIDLSTTYAQTLPGQMSSAFDYQRCGNPTILAFQRNIASIEGAKYALALNSGMSAITLCLSLLNQGDHYLCIDDLYSCHQRYLRRCFTPQTGITWDFADFTCMKKLRSSIKKNTKIVWMESPTNPTLKCIDIAAVAKVCKEKGCILVVDNTFMSPALQNPLKLGADISLNSVTKYIGGHTDVLGGCVAFNDDQLYEDLYFQMKAKGLCMAPFDAWVALRGCKTLQLRVEKASQNALEMAKWLEKHPKIEKVLFPGLPSHPQHKVALKNRAAPHLNGGSGMLCFYLKGDIKQVNKFLKGLKIVTLAESLGAVETLISCPALMTHSSVPADYRRSLGIVDNFVRLSMGIEGVNDIIADLKQALARI